MTAEEELIATLRTPVEIRTETFVGRPLHFVRGGSGAPILLLHGINIGWGQWYRAFDTFAAQGTVCALDMPGAGGSALLDPRRMDPETAVVEPVERFIIEQGLSDLRLVAHSFGAWVALRLAMRKNIPLRSIILVDPMGFSDRIPSGHIPITWRPAAELLAHTVMKPSYKTMRQFLASVFHDAAALPEPFTRYYLEGVRRDPRNRHPFIFINRLLQPFRIRPEFVLTDQLSSVAAPVTIIMAANDPLIRPADVQAAAAPLGWPVHIIPGAGHVPFIEAPATFKALAALLL